MNNGLRSSKRQRFNEYPLSYQNSSVSNQLLREANRFPQVTEDTQAIISTNKVIEPVR